MRPGSLPPPAYPPYLYAGLKPYTDWLRNRRADRLAKQFPRYNGRVLREFAESAPW